MTPREIAEEAAREIGHLIVSTYRPDFADIIERAIERALRGQWVSVEERLPEIEKRTLAANIDEKVVGCARYEAIGWNWGFRKVTHWQPLPPPPAKEQT